MFHLECLERPQHAVIGCRVEDKPGEECKHGTLSNHSSFHFGLFSSVDGGWTETNSVWLGRREGPCQNRDNTPEKISLKGIWRVQLSLYASCK